MKRTILLIAVLLSFSANANTVSHEEASLVATRFWDTHHPSNSDSVYKLSFIHIATLPHLYIADINGGEGFVIVAGDDCVRPILAYSFDSPFPLELNPELRYWLNGYEEQIADAVKADYQPFQQVVAEWSNLLKETAPIVATDIADVPAMLTTRWDQGNPYNKFCPYDSVRNGRAVVGCVATAMAQIMKFWNYPAYGEGSLTYQPTTGQPRYDTIFPLQSVDFSNTTYLWEFMPDELGYGTFSYQRDAVAIISYHCGVAVEMMYGLSANGGSSAYSSCGPWAQACATEAFWRYFKYDTTLYLKYRNSYSDSSWRALIDSQLTQGQPMYYAGHDSTGGHAFVLDGSDLQDRYHFNWGWSGYGDGFYTIDDLAPRSGGDGGNATYTFNLNQEAIFNIRPLYAETFDTVDYYDTLCNSSQYHDFYEYHLRVTEMDTLLRHLGTFYRYHLSVVDQKRVFLNPNISGQTPEMSYFCPIEGYTLPNCTFTNEGNMFIGWCRSKTGDDTIYQPGQHIDLITGATFFALWIDTTNAGIANIEASEEVTLWPNPTSGELYITLKMGHDAQVFVIDATGRTVMRENYPNMMGGNTKISLQSLPNGIYTVQIKTAMGTYNQRIIKR